MLDGCRHHVVMVMGSRTNRGHVVHVWCHHLVRGRCDDNRRIRLVPGPASHARSGDPLQGKRGRKQQGDEDSQETGVHGGRLDSLDAVLERVMGIEPTSKAWEAAVLPLNYTRSTLLV